MNEAETRAEYINPALKAAGWGVVEGIRIKREFHITQGRILGGGKRAQGKKADYVLVCGNTNLAVVEAKAWHAHYIEGVAQAKDYAGLMALRFGYACNGQAIYGVDVHCGVEGDVAQFLVPEQLWQRCFATANRWRDAFAAVPFADKSGSWLIRYYQDIAVNRVLERISDGADRILLMLATGTGKTSIAFQIARVASAKTQQQFSVRFIGSSSRAIYRVNTQSKLAFAAQAVDKSRTTAWEFY